MWNSQLFAGLEEALDDKFSQSFSVTVCALESGDENYQYPP
jgi:hypothetical protein